MRTLFRSSGRPGCFRKISRRPAQDSKNISPDALVSFVEASYHKLLILVALVAAVGSPALPQSQNNNTQDEPLKLSTQLVVVDAQVLSKKTGTPVNGLSERDFTIYEEGVKQQITHFSRDRLPLSIVLLLDVSASVMPVVEQVRNSGLKALNELKPGDEVALMAFGVWATVLFT